MSRKKIEAAKQEWEATVDVLPELICLLDDQGRIIRANRTVERWELGRVIDLKGRQVHALRHPLCSRSTCYLERFWHQALQDVARGQSESRRASPRHRQDHALPLPRKAGYSA